MIKEVERDGGVVWQVYGRAGGKKVYVGTFYSRREAEAEDRKQKVRQDQIDAGELAADAGKKRALDDAIDEWLRSIAGKRSHDEYKLRLANHVRPVLGEKLVEKITESDVESLRNALAKKFKPNTVNGVIAALSTAMEWMRGRKKWIAENPCRDVAKVEVPPRAFAWLQTTELVTKVLGECPDSIRNLIAVLVGTGMRIDEALHLRWDDIDLEHRLIHVQRGRRGAPKSGRLRYVPIIDSVLGVLKSMKLQRGDNVLLWPGEKVDAKTGERCARSRVGVGESFRRVTKRLGLKIRIHDLRHTFAGLYLVDHGDIFRLSKILGHASVAITEKIYAHLRPDAFETDYARVRFAMPPEQGAKVIAIK